MASDGSATTAEDTAVNITLTATDANGDTLTYSIVTAPTNGTLSGTAPNLTYTPAANYIGPDSFTFKANDGAGRLQRGDGDDHGDGAVNDAPVANDQSLTTPEDTAVNITLTASDVEGNPLTYSIVTPPANGTLSGTAPNLTYTPTANYSGPDSFTFKANDGTADSNVATVNDQCDRRCQCSAGSLRRLGDDVGRHGGQYHADSDRCEWRHTDLQYRHCTDQWHAQRHRPDPDLHAGRQLLWHRQLHLQGQRRAADSNIATVSIQVDAVNDAPVAASQTVTTTTDQAVNITLSASDVEGSPLTYTVVAAPQHGTLQGTGDTLVYTPNAGFEGNDQLTFQASDGQATSNVATVTIQVSDGPIGAGEQKVYLPLVRP